MGAHYLASLRADDDAATVACACWATFRHTDLATARDAAFRHVRAERPEGERTVASGIPIRPCDTCGRDHPVTRTHCDVCGIPSLFGHDTHTTTLEDR